MPNTANIIANNLSLRPPQRESLEILDAITGLVPLDNGNLETAGEILAKIQKAFPQIHNFEREFPSFCFALATGVGKTRLMGAFISYLYLAHGIKNYFVLAPGLTIYEKLIADFTPNTPKYVFRGIQEFALHEPRIITGDNYESQAGTLFDAEKCCVINIFNISKINSEVRGGKAPKIKQLKEYIGESYFDYLASLDDLVMLMDESHRYRGSAGVRAINELKPLFGLELTATPYTESSKGPVPFKNVIYDYPLGKAMNDGFVKDPVVVTRENFNPDELTPEEVERIKLEDGIRLHESVKVELEIFARERMLPIVKPFVLVIARDITHAQSLLDTIRSDVFFDGRYRDKVIQVDSSTKEDEVVERLLKVEQFDEPTEIVIHVNMLKEGWDVTNLYTIIPLRAANARTLVEQSIGRGLRLPYGKRTGHPAVDSLNIVAHDKFKEIVDETSQDDSPIRLKQLVLSAEQLQRKPQVIIAKSNLDEILAPTPSEEPAATSKDTTPRVKPVFSTKEELTIARMTQGVVEELSKNTETLPNSSRLVDKKIQKEIVEKVKEQYQANQLPGMESEVDLKTIVAKTTELIVNQTIDIPRILVIPSNETTRKYESFKLDLSQLRLQPVSERLYSESLVTHKSRRISVGQGRIDNDTPENTIVTCLLDYDEIHYDDNADLLFDLASKAVKHFCGYLSEEEMINVVRHHAKTVAEYIHAQMLEQRRETVSEKYDHKVVRGFTPLKPSQLAKIEGDQVLDFNKSPKDKSNMSRYVFGGFSRCLYPLQKFASEAERILATILDRDTAKWFKPVSGQFQLFYRFFKNGIDQHEYQPDFVAEADKAIFMLEPKASNKLDDPEVLAKQAAAETWCSLASEHTTNTDGKPWKYVLLPHDTILPNMTLAGLVKRFG